jgi:plasmid stabilization system protein ParE
LHKYYDKLQRPEAVKALIAALDTAWARIMTEPDAGLLAPRPYPEISHPGRLWIKAGRYWIAYRALPTPVVVAVFFETADIPNRL